MGFNNENAARLIFDIETVALPNAADYVQPASAPANYKSPEAIANYVEKATAEQLERAALDPDLNQIVCIGWWEEGEGGPSVFATDEMTEADLVRQFFSKAEGRELVGFNCLSFDILTLLRRSLYLGVRTPPLKIDKYRHDGIADLMQVLSFNGLLKYHSLNYHCKRLGIDVPDPMAGAGIAEAVDEGRWDDVKLHCEADVYKTAYLAEKLGLFSFQPVVF